MVQFWLEVYQRRKAAAEKWGARVRLKSQDYTAPTIVGLESSQEGELQKQLLQNSLGSVENEYNATRNLKDSLIYF